MLELLHIQNVALIERLSVSFSTGLHVLSGETGAGKSIIVDSLLLLLGNRAKKEVIRNGCDKAYVEGTFSLSDSPLARTFLKENDIEIEENHVTVSREIALTGRNVCRIEGVYFPLAKFRELTSLLMDIHGQHEHQSLLNPKNHRAQLDSFGDEKHKQLLQNVKIAFDRYSNTKHELEELKKQIDKNIEKKDLCTFQRNELKKANIVLDEEIQLAHEKSLLVNSEKIKKNIDSAYEYLYSAPSNATTLATLKQAQKALLAIVQYDSSLQNIYDRLESAYYELEDIAQTLQSDTNSIDFDEERLEYIHTRLDLLRRLGRKYGNSTAEMLQKLTDIEVTLHSIQTGDERLEKTEDALSQRRQEFETIASQLTASRKKLAIAFKSLIELQCNDLNMEGTLFQVKIAKTQPCDRGEDDCEFFIAPNLGENFAPLSQTASGGELSRLMLAIKSITASQTSIPSMVFDEIDTGISGRTAQIVAQKMADIAKYRQVLCVSHLTQIAAMADTHFVVAKAFDGNRTITTIKTLNENERVSEISRMLGGVDSDTESAKEHATNMLEQAREYKSKKEL